MESNYNDKSCLVVDMEHERESLSHEHLLSLQYVTKITLYTYGSWGGQRPSRSVCNVVTTIKEGVFFWAP